MIKKIYEQLLSGAVMQRAGFEQAHSGITEYAKATNDIKLYSIAVRYKRIVDELINVEKELKEQ
jgi:Trp operon repressor